MTKRRIEPLVWLTFSGGGVTAAIFLPVLVFLFAFAFPLGWITAPDHDHLLSVAGNPVTVLVLFGIFVPMLVHAAHRFRYTLYDGLQIKARVATAMICYGVALLLAAIAFVTLAFLLDAWIDA
jgi:fumarate reductase subunit D